MSVGEYVVMVLGQGSIHSPKSMPTLSMPQPHLCQGSRVHLPLPLAAQLTLHTLLEMPGLPCQSFDI